MLLSDFHYDLPEHLIAHYPLPSRSSSRLLCLHGDGTMQHNQFTDLLSLVSPNDLIVLNNTRVIPARLKGEKETGGKVEILIDRILNDKQVLVQMRVSKKPKPGSFLFFKTDNASVSFEVIRRQGDLFELKCHDKNPILKVLETIGEVPIPPYFQREPEKNDIERYQTVYAVHKGSVAAPTAGLHFDEILLQQLKERGVNIGQLTLHVGAGTFASIRVNDITKHRLHAESIHVSDELCEQIKKTKACGGRVIAVGTTTARSLETASRTGEIQSYTGETDIFIYPGFQFRCMDVLITNFHLPCSTLLMLVSAWGGYDNIMMAYRTAVQKQYRFYSYGDAMWIEKLKK